MFQILSGSICVRLELETGISSFQEVETSTKLNGEIQICFALVIFIAVGYVKKVVDFYRTHVYMYGVRSMGPGLSDSIQEVVET